MTKTARQNLSGFWVGRYSYGALAADSVQFMATINDQDGALSGTISEPNTMGLSSRDLRAFINGFRSGSDVSFAKTYDGASDAAHRIDYAGLLNDKGNAIVGRWSIGQFGGDFSMQRELLDESEIESHVVEELPL